MTVSVIAKGAIDKWGRQPLQIRISEGKQRKFIPLHIKVIYNKDDASKSEWDPETMTVTSLNPNHKDLNRRIRLNVALVENGQHESSKKGHERVGAVAYALTCFNKWEKELAPNTIRNYYSDRNNLKAYAPDITLDQITPTWWDNYKTWLYEKGLSPNSVGDQWKFLSKLLLQAGREKIIDPPRFDDFDVPKYKNPPRVHLSWDKVLEVVRVSKDPEIKPEVRHVAAWFAIACFTGIAYVEMTQFHYDNWIKDGLLFFNRQKTGTPVSLPMEKEVSELFEQVGNKPLTMTNQNFNRQLKWVAAHAGIKQKITAHTGRHSFATLMLAAGADLYHVSAMLGHLKVATTQIYAQIVNPKLHTEYKKLFQR